MNIATQLGLDDLDSGLLADATARWPSWAIEYPVLAPAGGPAQLRAWLLAAPGQQRNEVLCALAQLSTDQADEGLAAAAALMWALIPGAARIALRLRSASPVIEELVAAQLWLEVRTLTDRAGDRLAANILARVAKGVIRDLGLTSPHDRAWEQTVLVDPHANQLLELPAPAEDPPPAVELRHLLASAHRDRVITGDDVHLLVRLARESDHDGSRPSARSGLLSEPATARIGRDEHISARHVRRRARRAMDAIARAYTPEGAPA